MKNNLMLLFALALIFSGSCKKEYPATPVPAAPEFTFSGTVNGSAVNLQAGLNNYYMFTSYHLDSTNNVYDFKGEFRDKNCSAANCANTLKVAIRDYRSYSTPTVIDSAIIPGYYSFATPSGSPTRYSVQFRDTLINEISKTYTWSFGDGEMSNFPKPTHVYDHPGIYNVSLVESSGGCNSSITNPIAVGQAGNSIITGFAGSALGNNVTLASSPSGGTAPYTYNWSFGDGNTATTSTYTCSHTYSLPGIYHASLSVTDANNMVQTSNANVATNPAPGCYVNFYPKLPVPLSNSLNLSNAIVEWCDGNGLWWTSTSFSGQPAKSLFKIISVENYQNNINGQPTKKIHAKITCTLYNGSNSIILDGDAVFSVAHL